jgi:precorrin-6x reductase
LNGTLHLVSVGPGYADLIPPLAERALRASDVVVGYELYLRWVEPWIAGKEIHTPPLTQERARAEMAIRLAREGRRVALVSSGDIGVYAMAALAFEVMREDDRFEVQVVPGITSANACASLLGSPLSHDFATLSLSDLLCPWEWIETRARRIAEADLAVVLYNVQSRSRQEGVYRILRLLLEHKRADTWCGVVRNAYRPEQEVSLCTLEELLGRRFDMLTTLVIGNRFTQRRRDWIFTPRGYHAWDEARDAAVAAAPAAPRGAVWVFSGTGDGNALARELAARSHPVVVSAATEYGGEVALASCPGVHVRSGRMGVEARRRELRDSGARLILDATHPFAAEMSRQLIELSVELGIPYLRYERPSAPRAASTAEVCGAMEEAARRAVARGRRIFLATGSKDLGTFLGAPGAGEREWFVRMTPEPELIQRAVDLGLPRTHICAMQGPFSREFNEALWRAWRIDCVVTKESGDAGGFDAKAEAAAALDVPLVVVGRPAVAYPRTASDFESVLHHLSTLLVEA